MKIYTILVALIFCSPLFSFGQTTNPQSTDSENDRTIYIEQALFSGAYFVQGGNRYRVGLGSRNLLNLMQQTPQAFQQIELANSYNRRASLASLIGLAGGIGLAIVGSTTGRQGYDLAGSGVFLIGNFTALNFRIKSSNRLNKGVWLYNQQQRKP